MTCEMFSINCKEGRHLAMLYVKAGLSVTVWKGIATVWSKPVQFSLI